MSSVVSSSVRLSRQVVSRSGQTLRFSAATASTTTPTSNVPLDNDDSGYVSPFKEFFDTIHDKPQVTTRTPERLLKCGISEDNLRFTTTHYGRLQLPPHVHAWEHRVTVRVGLKEIPIDSELEMAIFRQIVGSRFNQEKNVLQLSSNQFGSRIENKRHLVSMLDRIVLGAKRLAKQMEQQPEQEQSA